MAPKHVLAALALAGVMALAGCTAGHGGGSGTSTSTSGGAAAGGCVSGPGGGACLNTTASGSASASGSSTSSTSTGTNGTTNATAPTTATVMISGMKFVNGTLTVKMGGTVTWEHHDGSTAHTVTSDTGLFDSSPNCTPPVTELNCMKDGDTFHYTFSTAGDFPYHCKVHTTTMTGTIHVVA